MPRRISGWTRWIFIAAAVVILAAGAIGALLFLRPAVVVTQVVEGPVVEAFYATGTLEPIREYPVKSSTAGIVHKPELNESYLNKGDAVKAGQALAVIPDPQLQFAYDKAAAELEETRQRADTATSPVLKEFDARITASQELLDVARREQGRVTHLLETGGTSQSDFDKVLDRVKNTWSDLESFKAQKEQTRLLLHRQLEVADAALAAAKRNLDLQTVRAPVDGVVLDRPVSLGTHLNINDHLLQIADVRPKSLVMRAQVDEEDITKVRVGQTVRMVLYAFAGRPFEGKVARIYDKADPDRRTFEVDITPLQPDPQFAAGLTGELAFEVTSKASALIVPSQAVQGGQLWVLRGHHLHATPVQFGIRGVERTEVVSGVHTGDLVLISPAADLRDGQAVRENVMSPQAAAALNKPKEKEVFRGGVLG